MKGINTDLVSSNNVDFTDNQLVQLVKIAETLPRDQQKMLVHVLSEKVKSPKHHAASARSPQPNYQGLYQKLMDTFKKVKQNTASLGNKGAVPRFAEDLRMKQQKEQLDLLTKQYTQEAKILEQKQVIQDYKAE